GREGRVVAGHPWIYRSEVAELVGDWRAEEAVTVLTHGGTCLGRGFYNPRPSLVCRLLTGHDEPVDRAFLRRGLHAALSYRQATGRVADAFRWVWSEADALAGLVVDRYGPIAVIQCLTLGVARWRSAIVEAVMELGACSGVFAHDDPTAARLEGFEPLRGWVAGRSVPEVEITEGACRFVVSVERGQKTGFYLDQRDTRLALARYAQGRRLLDAFAYSGAFACHGLVAGAEHATVLEISAEALAFARRNLALNGVEGRADCREVNVFDELRRLERAGEHFGLIILDPPPFTRRKEALEAAARGYKEINLRALRLLEPGGILATFSCSHHVSPTTFEEICRAAAQDAGITVRVLAGLSQAQDHPVLLTVPETRYLKGLLLEAT
ncbi:MAG: class I SAM-dependent rRNA methyltransferase, partial [Nitrospinota bacterium]